MKKLILLTIIVLISNVLLSQNDTLKVYWLKPVLIESSSYVSINHKIEKGNYTDVLSRNGFSLISKGVFFAQDIYSDGFKRGDINIVIDGERYHNACPNRMDPPLTRINPISMSSISLYKTNSTLQSGFAGSVEFQRNKPETPFKVKTGISGSQGNSETFDGYLNTNYKHNEIGLRYSFGKPYKDGENRDYKTLYSYKDNYSYSFAEGTINGIKDDLKYGLSYSHSNNILFPYLQMDEIFNNVASANFKYKSYKVYFNYTDHLMTNELRVSPSYMETKARNFTLGIFNDFLEFYFRNWLSDNKIVMGNVNLVNKAIPNLRQYSLTGQKIFAHKNFTFNVKAGGLINFIGSENMDYYNVNYPDISDTKLFYKLSLSSGYNSKLNKDTYFGTLLEFSTEAPEPENLYIAIRRPGNNAWWSGNPDLINPAKITLRAMLNNNIVKLELYGNYVYNYVNLTKKVALSKNYLTYDNINAYIIGANIALNYKFLSSELSYSYGQNVSNEIPLSEIAPLRITTNIVSPEFVGISLYLTHIYNNAQTRVDETLFESKSNTYNVINLGLNYVLKELSLSLEVRNILNNTYYNFLSYARNPYSSGARVYETGRNVVFGVLYSF